MPGQKRKYTEEMIRAAVPHCNNYSDVCRYLGMNRAQGSCYEMIRNRIKEHGIDISHFLGKGSSAGKRNPNYEVLVASSDERFTRPVDYRVSHGKLERYLLRNGREYKCEAEGCGISEWKGEPLTLDIDHIDGDWSNCYKDNLRFLCPNCHRQTKTFAGKNKKGTVAEVD